MSSDQPINPPVSPDHIAAGPETAPTRWHIVVGVLGLVYGAAGVLLHLGSIVMSFFSKQFFKMAGLGEIETPRMMVITALIQSSILLVLGGFLIVGSAMILARRPLGATLLRFWAGARIAMVVVGIGLGILTLKPQLEFQSQIIEAQKELVRDRGGDPSKIPSPDPKSQEMQARIMMAVFSVVLVAFPLFVGILLTSRRKKAEIEAWREISR